MKFTRRQGQYLAFMHQYRLVHGRSPAEAEIARFFDVSAPSAHQMVVSLAKKGLISRIPGAARSIRVLVDPGRLPPLPGQAAPADSPPRSEEASIEEAVVTVANRIVDKLYEENEGHAMHDREIVPLLCRVLEGVEEGLVQVDAGPLAAERAKERVCAHAERLYVKMCAAHDPENADEAADAVAFQHLLRGTLR